MIERNGAARNADTILGQLATGGAPCADLRCEALLLRAERAQRGDADAARGLALDALAIDPENPRATALLLELSADPKRLAGQLAPQAIRRCDEQCRAQVSAPDCFFVKMRLELSLGCVVRAMRSCARAYAFALERGGDERVRGLIEAERERFAEGPAVIAAALEGMLEQMARETPGPVVPDAETLLALYAPREGGVDEAAFEAMARAAHEAYALTDPTIGGWDSLQESLKASNRDQARYFPLLADFACFALEKGAAPCIPSREEWERMARLEHGRWNADRLRSGWRFGAERDRDRKISPYLCSWEELPDSVRRYDYEAVENAVERFAGLGYGLVRR